jgi:hypothetical protein
MSFVQQNVKYLVFTQYSNKFTGNLRAIHELLT